MPSLTVENYLKAIYQISSREGSQHAVGTGAVAQAMDVSPGTVTGMLKTLSESELARYTPYEGVRLTPQGEQLALKVLRRHRLLELFLVQTLAMPWDEVHEEAEHMEHAVSDQLIDRIDAYLGYPDRDPHGDPIPRSDGTFSDPVGVPLTELTVGKRFRVVRVVDQDSVFLRYLSECGLDLGAVGEVAEHRPESGALVLKVGTLSVAFGSEPARKVLVVEA